MPKKITSSLTGIFLALALTTGLYGCGEKKSRYIKETGNIQWPEIQQETKPWTRWWWHGSAVTEEGLKYTLEEYQKSGLGGVEITPIYGVRGEEDQFIDFLSPEWMDKLMYTLNEAKRLGLGVDLANASGWPFGGPWVDEEIECKYIASSVFRVEEGGTFSESMSFTQKPYIKTEGLKVTVDQIKYPVTANENLQDYAFDQIRYPQELPLIIVTANKIGSDEVIDLTNQVKDKRLEWTAPGDGEWIVCALYQGNHGKMVERAGPGGEGNVIDHFSEEALLKYLARFDDAFKGYDLSYLRYFFNDSYEVDDANGESTWTPEFFKEFEKRRGYDLRKYIPALLGLDNDDTNSRVIYDYRVTIGDLLLEKYTMAWQKWAADKGKGIRNQSHGSPANVLDLYAASDIPEIEGRDIVNLKSAPSAAHVTGKKLVSSESATWLNEHFHSTLGDVKNVLDNFLLAGVNHIFYHGTAYSPEDAEWPGRLFYAAVHFAPQNSFWEDFGTLNQYITRSQSFLQEGRPSNDILLYFNISDVWSSPGRSMLKHFHSGDFFNNISIKECGDYLTQNGYSWDAISDKQLQDVSYSGGQLVTGGNNYKVIAVPFSHHMPVETFEKLAELADKGSTILFFKELPSDVPGLSGLEKSRKKMETIKDKISFKEVSDQLLTADYGKGKIIMSADIKTLFENSGISPEKMYTDGLQSIRRVKDDGNYYYFIKNTSKNKFDGWVALNTELGSAALYDPMHGTDGYARTRISDGKTEIYIQLDSQESIIVETFKGKYSGKIYPFYEKNGQAITLSGKWEVEFIKGGPNLPAKKIVADLGSWTEYGQEYSIFSGTAEYTTILPALPEGINEWLLDLGNVKESASVYLNGEYIGTMINHPYSIVISDNMFKGNDELKVRVSNLMANRIADLDKRNVNWRIFYNTNFPARRRDNTGPDGKFSAAKWNPMASGLLGDVTLTPLKEAE